jgi:triphosphoribosyl-dephospho-CoA synthase
MRPRSRQSQSSSRSQRPIKQSPSYPWSIGQIATLSIILEASSRKAGNVFPGVSFSDMHYEDFVRSAMAIGPVLDQAGRVGTGRLIYRAVEATRSSVGINTNLGTLLLLVPMAVALHQSQQAQNKQASNKQASSKQASNKQLQTVTPSQLKNATRKVLQQLDKSDSQWVYKAIVLASPGGLGSSDKMDVRNSKAPDDLLEAMRLASPLDWIARSYANNFEELFQEIAPAILQEVQDCGDTSEGVRRFQVRWLAKHGDSLVLRKQGEHENQQLMLRAAKVASALDALSDQERQQLVVAQFEKQWLQLDRWLRAKGNRRNPGTTADLIAAALFVLLATDQLTYSSSASPVGRAN